MLDVRKIVLVLAISSGFVLFGQEVGNATASQSANSSQQAGVPVPAQAWPILACGESEPTVVFQDSASRQLILACKGKDGKVVARSAGVAPIEFGASVWNLEGDFFGLAFPGRLWRRIGGVWDEFPSSFGSSLLANGEELLVSGLGRSGSHDVLNNKIVRGPSCFKFASMGSSTYCLDNDHNIYRRTGKESWQYLATVENANGLASDGESLYVSTSAVYGMGGTQPIPGVGIQPILPTYMSAPQVWGTLVRVTLSASGAVYNQATVAEGLEPGYNSISGAAGKIFFLHYIRNSSEPAWEIRMLDGRTGKTEVFLSRDEVSKVTGATAYPQAFSIFPRMP